VVLAAGPSVTKVAVADGKIVITGSSLGSHPDQSQNYPEFLNIAWNDFEDGVMAKNGFTLKNTNNNWSIATDNNRANSKKYAEKTYNGHRGGYIGLNQAEKISIYYYTFWIKLRANTQSGKISRIWGANDQNLYLSSGNENTKVRGYFEQGLGGPAQWGSPNGFGSETWHRVEIKMDVPNHTVILSMDGIHQWTRTDWVPTTFNGKGRIWEIGGMIDDPKASGGKDGGYNYDDVYFSGTQARVELGNAATWNACTRKEIQIPKAWGATSITAKPNYGAFNSGNTAYLYVVDSQGNISNGGQGVKITAGKQSQSEPSPAEPSPVIVNITTK
jgi:hypothetical protein